MEKNYNVRQKTELYILLLFENIVIPKEQRDCGNLP